VRRWEIIRGLAGFALALAFLMSMVALAFFLTTLMYRRIGVQPSPVLAQIINALLGIFFAMLIGLGVGALFASKRTAREMGVLGPIVDALDRIAKGDFSVRLDDTVRDNRMVSTLAKSVNTVALELNQIESMRQEFVSNVSHEIQSPLTSIRGFARALQNDQLNPADRAHYLAIIEAETMRLSKLSDNLLKLTSLESEHVPFAPKPYRLHTQLRDLLLASEPQWLAKGIEVDVALEDVVITADEDMLSQVWINLIYNSIKFTPDGGSVRIATRRCGESVECCIADTGIGIAEEDLPHVFERFYKADASRTRLKDGSGLGLAIVKKIVDIHGGTIGVESTPGVGTTVRVALPAG
jgi:two-component system, OmpR family, phosphate regulon sensor histidine kinase PhoR